jgi:hypothetical protein
MQTARSIGVAVLAMLLAAGCGSGDQESAAASQKAKREKPAATEAAPQGAEAQVAAVKPTDKEARLATAVADTKTTAPIDLLYDIPAKPEIGQPFTVELTLKPRVLADALDVEVADTPGLEIQGERTARFPSVEAGQPYTFQVQVVGNTAGLYYVAVTARISTQVQSDVRAFSVPVVIGTPAPLQKPTPQQDASGQPIESLPAKES